MSNAKKCDRCGKFYEKKDLTMKVKGEVFGRIGLINLDKNTFIDDIDLCNNCSKDLINWLNRKGEKYD